MRSVVIYTVGLVLLIAASWLLSGSGGDPALATSGAIPLPPCGTPQPFTGSITGSDPTHTNFLNDTAGPDSCLNPRSCPSITTGSEVFHYDLYNLINPDAVPRQVIVQVNGSGCQTPLGVYSAAYLNIFNPAALCQNWIASTGGPVTGITNYSFTVPANGTFVIEVEEYSTTIGCVSYGLTVTVLCNGCPFNTSTPTRTPTTTPTGPATNTPTRTPTLAFTATSTPTRTPTLAFTPTNTPTRTFTYTPTRTSTPTSTAVPPTSTSTSTPTSTPTPCTISFSDVFPTDYFYEAVRYLYCHGAISGYADGTFRPSSPTTRGQLCKIVVLAEGFTIYVPPAPTFIDVPADHPFYQYIETAYHQGIISGYTCGANCLEFRPDTNVTRAQACKVVVRAEGWPLYTPVSPTFSDLPSTKPFYAYVETSYAYGVVSGYQCGTGCLQFRPSADATRGQISKIVYIAVTHP